MGSARPRIAEKLLQLRCSATRCALHLDAHSIPHRPRDPPPPCSGAPVCCGRPILLPHPFVVAARRHLVLPEAALPQRIIHLRQMAWVECMGLGWGGVGRFGRAVSKRLTGLDLCGWCALWPRRLLSSTWAQVLQAGRSRGSLCGAAGAGPVSNGPVAASEAALSPQVHTATPFPHTCSRASPGASPRAAPAPSAVCRVRLKGDASTSSCSGA